MDVVDYRADNWLRCWFAGINLDDIEISMYRKEADWIKMMADTMKEQWRILKSGGYLILEVGEVRSGKILLEKLVWDAVENLAFDRLGVMVHQQEFTKTSNCWGITNNQKGTNSNRMVILRKR
ncbi:MAG: hypothetical protein D6698_05620 [Gammaproteobacteria bacterium]|nr:MAG: hypothetical protein D6698_05620 [Gammaproteobacteria bacterium]